MTENPILYFSEIFNFNWLFQFRVTCLIHNGTLYTLSDQECNNHFLPKYWLFPLCFIASKTVKKIYRIKHLSSDEFFLIIDQMKVKRVFNIKPMTIQRHSLSHSIVYKITPLNEFLNSWKKVKERYKKIFWNYCSSFYL